MWTTDTFKFRWSRWYMCYLLSSSNRKNNLSNCCHTFPCLKWLYHHILSINSYRFRESGCFISITVQFMMCAKHWVNFDLKVAYMYIYIYITELSLLSTSTSLIARFMGPTWGPSGADRTQVGPMLAPWTFVIWVITPQTARFMLLAI